MGGVLLASGIGLGVLISVQWQSQLQLTGPALQQSNSEIVAVTIQRLEAEQSDLKRRLADLRSELDTARTGEHGNRATLQELSAEIDRERIVAGMVALQGPGVVAGFDDSTARSVAPGEDPANYILHDYDLRDILNALWIAGAEAISLNGERIVSNSSLYCVGSTILCNTTRLSPPYVIHAIGDPAALEAALYGSPQMEKFNQRAEIYDLPVEIKQHPSVEIPAYSGFFDFRDAEVVR